MSVLAAESSVFVCYARADEEFVLPFAKQLQAKGMNVWLDHLTNLDLRDGDPDYLLSDTLYLHLRDTGATPIPSRSVFAEFANTSTRASLQRTLDAPYLVIVRPPHGHLEGAPAYTGPQSPPFRLYLYNLTRKEVVCATSVIGPAATGTQLEKAVYSTLEQSVGATVLR